MLALEDVVGGKKEYKISHWGFPGGLVKNRLPI